MGCPAALAELCYHSARWGGGWTRRDHRLLRLTRRVGSAMSWACRLAPPAGLPSSRFRSWSLSELRMRLSARAAGSPPTAQTAASLNMTSDQTPAVGGGPGGIHTPTPASAGVAAAASSGRNAHADAGLLLLPKGRRLHEPRASLVPPPPTPRSFICVSPRTPPPFHTHTFTRSSVSLAHHSSSRLYPTRRYSLRSLPSSPICAARVLSTLPLSPLSPPPPVTGYHGEA